jgi:glycosyltransferase involved in cell wall biosynthesis
VTVTASTVSFIVASRSWDRENIARIRTMLPAASELIVSTVPGGAAYARNVGAASARGEVLAFFDDDVQLSADWDRFLRTINDPRWDFGIAEWYTPAHEVRSPWMVFACGALNILTRVVRYPLAMSGFTAMRRRVFEEVGGYPLEGTYEEPALTMRLHGLGFHGVPLPVRVTMLRSWDSFHRFNDATSRGKPHPVPGPSDVVRVPAMF